MVYNAIHEAVVDARLKLQSSKPDYPVDSTVAAITNEAFRGVLKALGVGVLFAKHTERRK